MSYHQITSEERYILSALRKQGMTTVEIARHLGRHRSTVWRELKRNGARLDGTYRPSKAIELTAGRRRRSRQNQRFGPEHWQQVEALLQRQWSPEQVAGHLDRTGALSISHETIYRHIWADWRHGGLLHKSLRGARKQRRKRNGRYDSRGRLAGKRHISERPAAADNRSRVGHWEIDTVMGHGSKDCIVSIVARRTGYLVIGKLRARTTDETSSRTIALIRTRACRFGPSPPTTAPSSMPTSRSRRRQG